MTLSLWAPPLLLPLQVFQQTTGTTGELHLAPPNELEKLLIQSCIQTNRLLATAKTEFLFCHLSRFLTQITVYESSCRYILDIVQP